MAEAKSMMEQLMGSGGASTVIKGVAVAILVAFMAASSSGALTIVGASGSFVAETVHQEVDNGAPGDNSSINPIPGQTTLRNTACPGIATLSVRGTRGFKAGDTIRINPSGPTQEDAQVVDVDCFEATLHLAQALRFRHAANEPIIVIASASSQTAPTVVSSRVNEEPDLPRRTEESDSPPRRTEEQRLQQERTNRGGLDDVRTEGSVVAVGCADIAPCVVIANRDGKVDVRLLCGNQCPTIAVGDYLEMEGEKIHEGLFEATDVTKRR